MAIDVAQEDGVIILKPSGKLIGRAVTELRQTIDNLLPSYPTAGKIQGC